MSAALLLAWRGDGLDAARREDFERVAASMPRRVRALQSTDLVRGRALVRTWALDPDEPAPGPHVDGASGGWVAVVGNPTPRAGIALAAAPGERALATRLRAAGLAALDELSPPFAVVVGEPSGEAAVVAVDRCGLQHLYAREDRDGTVWVASSALALGRALGATLDAEGAAEWLAAGHFVSQRTFAREVRKLAPGERLRLGPDGCAVERRWLPPRDPPPAGDDEYRSSFLDALAACHRDDGTAAELTGGLDSRLVLSGRIERGLPTLSWTLGQPGCAELRTVERLRERAGFEHIAVPIDATLGDRLPELALAMHELADGEVNAVEYAPLLLAFEALDGRRRVSVSGSGGEVARAFYWRAARRHGGVDALVRLVAAATGPARAALRPELAREPLEPLRAAVDEVVRSSPGRTAPAVLDDFYLRARMQRFAGRNVTTTGLFCRQALPFLDDRVVDAALALPAARKRQGRVVRDAVAAWAPALARVPLESGIAVRPRSWRAPGADARWALALARKALSRHGGALGRRVARPDPEPVPWDAVRAAPAFRDFVGDLLLARDSRIGALLDPGATAKLVERSLAGASLYPLGLVLTLELTLRSQAAQPGRS